ncbi:hypothetical protein L4C38_15285 [Vibrio kasasachensis]|uniref:hypothetical protein n=1 Tax=Vibrio kasasachensis TaxID=2910248 RepID=UPI003D0EC9D3
MKKSLLVVLVLILFSTITFAQSALEKPAIDILVAPTLILGQGRYAQAADSFHSQSNYALTLERKLGSKAMWQAAGLADGLAAIAAEKDKDPIAYEYWANSVRYFLMSGSSWEELQSKLHLEFEQSSSRLQVNMSPGDSGVSVGNAWLELFSLVEVWQEKLGYFTYRSPSSELADQVLQSQRNDRRNVTSNGSQLRQYSPNSKLKINAGFQSKQTFRPEAEDKGKQSFLIQRAATSISTNIPQAALVKQPEQAKGVPEPIVVTTPIVIGREIIEQDAKSSQSPTFEAEEKKSNDALDETGKFRANLGAESGKGITATQRRSFSPETSD